MPCFEGLFDRCFRSPVTIRIVTNIVLLISDIDVVFSILFARQLYIIGGLYAFFLFVMAVGLLTYASGIFYFGPRQKFRTVKVIKEMITQHPEWFEVEEPRKTKLNLDSSLNPKERSGTFKDLKNTQDDCNEMREALSRYKLPHIWTYADRKNALNTCEVKHGLPFLRLARFGFMAQPSCKDLGGILNANALYSFSTGIFQLAISTLLIASTERELSLFILLPFSVSAASLVLSVANVLLDFSGILSEIENEKRLVQEILDKLESNRVQDKTRSDTNFEEKKRAIEAEYADRTTSVDVLQKSKEMDEAAKAHSFAMAATEKWNMQALSDEIRMYRRRLQNTKQALSGKTKEATQPNSDGPLDSYERLMEPLEAQKQNLQRLYRDQINNLDMSKNADELKLDLQKLEEDYNKKMTALNEAIQRVKDTFEFEKMV